VLAILMYTRGSGDTVPVVLISALYGCKWLASRSGRFTNG